jgi:hypothetical protein
MVISEAGLSQKDLERWRAVQKLALKTDKNGNLVNKKLFSLITKLQSDSRTFVLTTGSSGPSSGVAGTFEVTKPTGDGKDFTEAKLTLDFDRVSGGNATSRDEYGLGFTMYGGLQDDDSRFAELVGHEFAHGEYAISHPGEYNQYKGINDTLKFLFNNLPNAGKWPGVIQLRQSAQELKDNTEKHAQIAEKEVNEQLRSKE